jgi:plasmid stabilization system protein ParE
MGYRLEFSVRAIRQIDSYFEHLRRYSFDTADKYRAALQHAIDTYLVNTPTTFDYYWETGAPYRAFLFNEAPRTTYWIIYRVYEDEGLVRVLQFRNTAMEEGTHGL